MASGIDWFRWHHGSVTDPKFQLVAKKSGASVAEVIAVWAFMLEESSMAEERGNHGMLDFDSIDCALGLDDGKAHAIYSNMEVRGLIEDGRVLSWEKRQPKRERTDDNSSVRVKAFREKQRHVTPNNEDETPCNATERQETPREEKSRQSIEANASVTGKPVTVSAAQPQCPADDLIDLYHELMPLNPPVKVLNDARRKAIRSRWKEAALLTCQPFGYANRQDGILAWRRFFEVCAESEFLTGRAKPTPGKPPFLADIDFLFSPSGFVKCLENKFHREVTV